MVLTASITCTGGRSREVINFSPQVCALSPAWCAGLIIRWIFIPLKVLTGIILSSSTGDRLLMYKRRWTHVFVQYFVRSWWGIIFPVNPWFRWSMPGWSCFSQESVSWWILAHTRSRWCRNAGLRRRTCTQLSLNRWPSIEKCSKLLAGQVGARKLIQLQGRNI